MPKMSIDGTLSIDLPKGFVTMSADELKEAYGIDYKDMWGVQNERRHASMMVIWKDSGKIVTKMAGEKYLAKRAEKALRKAYVLRGYQFGEFFSTEICGHVAEGVRYEFLDIAGATVMGETIVFKNEERCYTLYYYSRGDHEQNNRRMYEDALSSLAWG